MPGFAFGPTAAGRPTRALDVRALLQAGAAAAAEQAAAVAWARQVMGGGPADSAVPLVYSTATATELAATQAELGALEAGARVEQALAGIARVLADAGVRRWVVAGGETSGAVVQALGAQALRIGASICPGVPWTQAQRRAAGEGPADAAAPIWLALKSGSFGAPDFFSVALRMK